MRSSQCKAGTQPWRQVAHQVGGVPCIVRQLHSPVAHCVGSDGGMVKLAWYQGQLLTDTTSSNLLVHLVGTLLRLGIKLWIFQDFPLGSREPLAEIEHPVAEFCRRCHPALTVRLKSRRFQARGFAAGASVQNVFHS